MQTTRRAKRMKKADLTRSLKIRMYPNSSRKTLLRQWMGCARLVYNMVVDNYRLGHRTTRQFFFRMLLRLKIKHTKEWIFMDKVPYEVLDHAISDTIQARDEVIKRNKENQHQHHDVYFRSKKMIISQLPSMLNTVTNYSSFISDSYIIKSFLLLILIIHVTKWSHHFIMNIEDAIMVGRMRLAKLKWTRS